MADLYSNNAVGTLAGAISDSDTTITLVDAPWAHNFAYNESEADFQRATITADDPLDFEIVHITVNDNSLTLTVARGQEDTVAKAWPAGAKLSARVTAGQLEQFVGMDIKGNMRTRPGVPSSRILFNSRTNAETAPVQLAGYPVLPLMTAQPTGSAGTSMSQDHNMGREAVGGSLMVDLGDAVPTWTSGNSYPDGSIVAPPTPDGFNYVFQATEGWETSQTTTTPDFSGDGYSVDALDSGGVVGLWVPVPAPLTVNLNFPGTYGLVLSEVGFICMSHDASSAPAVSVGTNADATRFANAVTLTDATETNSVHRIPVTAGGALVKNLLFTLETPATGRLTGRFYWRGFFVQLPS